MTRRIYAPIVCLAGWLSGAPVRAGPPDAPVTEVVVIAEGLDAGGLAEALALRVPGARVVPLRDVACAARQGDPRCGVVELESLYVREDMSCGTGCVLARIGPEADGTLRVEVRGGDGRLYRRLWSASIAEPERAAATSLSHLLAAIEEGTAEPEPPPVAAGPALPSEPGPDAAVVPGPARPASAVPPTAVPAAPPRIEVGPTVGLVHVVGVGPPAALAGWVGSGGLVGVELRGRGGLLGGLELRGLGARTGELRLGRLRVAAALGHGLRRGLFELRTRAAFTVEPWWVGARGDRAQHGGPLLGAAASLTPGLSAALAPRVQVDVGLRLEAAVSVDPRRAAVVQLVDAGGTPLLRLGGVELAAAAEIGVRWGR